MAAVGKGRLDRASGGGRFDQPQVDLMHQGRRVQGVAGVLPGQMLRRESAQLIVDDGQQLRSGLGIARFQRREYASDFVHPLECNRGTGRCHEFAQSIQITQVVLCKKRALTGERNPSEPQALQVLFAISLLGGVVYYAVDRPHFESGPAWRVCSVS